MDEPAASRVGDHRPVVRAQLGAWIADGRSRAVRHAGERRAEPAVRAHAAGDDECPQPGRLEGAAALDHQRVDDGILERAGHVGPKALVAALALQSIACERLEAAEAEIESRPVRHRAREPEAIGVAGEGEVRERGAAGVRETEQRRDLVERLPRRIVHRLPEDAVRPDRRDFDELGMSTRDEQREERERGRVGLQHRGEQVAFHVMDRERRHVPRTGQAPAERGADQQRPHQSRTRGIGHAVDVGGPGVRLGEHPPHEPGQTANVIARGKLRHHASVLGMDGDLRMHEVGEQTARGVVHRNSGLVAGRLDSKDTHRRTVSVPAFGRPGRWTRAMEVDQSEKSDIPNQPSIGRNESLPGRLVRRCRDRRHVQRWMRAAGWGFGPLAGIAASRHRTCQEQIICPVLQHVNCPIRWAPGRYAL